MDKRSMQFVKMLRDLVSNVQGAPFPGEDVKPELYKIWYEHAQKSAVECFEFLNDNFPEEQSELDKTIDRLFQDK